MNTVVDQGGHPDGTASVKAPATGKVLAWGIETATGLARHIRELPRDRTGAASGIECVGCGKPLLAFNAGKSTWQVRPHFYHPNGTQRDDCHIVAGRLAAVERLMREGVITLPAQRMSGQWSGISGKAYGATRVAPQETVRLASVSYSDRTRALLTMPDGRSFVVMLRGEFHRPGDGLAPGREAGLACLVIEAGAHAHLLSQMDPEQLREHLTLLPDDMAWTCHWDDEALRQGAQQDAMEKARQALDELPPGMDPLAIEGTTPEGRRESLLHALARDMVAAAGAIDVPGWRFPVEHGDVYREPAIPSHRLHLSDVRVERRLADRIPDIQCSATAEPPSLNLSLLAIEVVVYSDVSAEKLNELRTAGAAVLSLNFRNWAGSLTLDELRELTLTNLHCKQWLHHPLKAAQWAQLDEQRARTRAWAEWNRHAPDPHVRSRLLTQPSDPADSQKELQEVGRRYREVTTEYLSLLPHRRDQISSDELLLLAEQRAVIWAELESTAAELRDLGAPGGADAAAIRMMPRLLSIREDRGIGQAPSQNAGATINHVRTEIKVRDARGDKPAKASPDAALEYLAYMVYELQGRKKAPNRPSEQVAALLRASLEDLETRYEWDWLYLPLIKAVFPEMRAGIERLAKRMHMIARERARLADGPQVAQPGSRAQVRNRT